MLTSRSAGIVSGAAEQTKESRHGTMPVQFEAYNRHTCIPPGNSSYLVRLCQATVKNTKSVTVLLG